MKKLIKLFSVVLAGLIILSCGDDDSEPGYKIRVDDESYRFSHAYSQSFEATNEEEVDGYRHNVILTGGGLKVDVAKEEFDGSGNLASFILFSGSAEIEEGTYILNEDPDFGDAGGFTLATDFNGVSFDDMFTATSGTIEVSKSGDKYIFKFDFDEYETAVEDDDPIVGEGSIKGSFTGEVELISTTELGKEIRLSIISEVIRSNKVGI
jgi:hypothetical protein